MTIPPSAPAAEPPSTGGFPKCRKTSPDTSDGSTGCSGSPTFPGDDWRGTEKGERLERDFAAVGVEVVYFPYTVHTSSTQLRRALDALVSRPGALSAP